MFLFISQFFGYPIFIFLIPFIIAISPIIEYVVIALYFILVYMIIISIPVLYSTLPFLVAFLLYIEYTIPSLAYEIDADSYAAMKLKDRALVGYLLFTRKKKISTGFISRIFNLLTLLDFTHPSPGYEYLRLMKFVRKMKNKDF